MSELTNSWGPVESSTENCQNTANEHEIVPLTAIEKAVIESISLGMTTLEAARQRFVSPNTIKFHLASIYTKTQASNNAHAVRIGIERGDIEIEQLENPFVFRLTSRDLEVLELMSLGFNRQTAAQSLGVSQESIKFQLKQVRRKLLARNAPHAVRRAFEYGYFPFPTAREEVSNWRIVSLLLDNDADIPTDPSAIAE